MKTKKLSVVCNSISLSCWGVLLCMGIRKGNNFGAILYGVCTLLSAITLISNIISIKKEKHSK